MTEPFLYINQYADYCAQWRAGKGFVTSWENMLEKLMLVVTEVAEAAEAYRHNDSENFEEEIADTFIRLMDITGTLGIDIEKAIISKMAFNENRPYQHGAVMGDVADKVKPKLFQVKLTIDDLITVSEPTKSISETIRRHYDIPEEYLFTRSWYDKEGGVTVVQFSNNPNFEGGDTNES